ncbi:MAG: hypothetical protein E6J41_30150 [Chloroflexi bacterium]|nr:MAG: hypothetical protein E6J41_30150 [Chloroflexota bacterium]
MSAAGALRFGRYAFPPNRLGYCGPPDHAALLGYVAGGRTDRGLVELERRFEGAYPYLALIALANRIPDPFHELVVDAYWIGNHLLTRVGAAPFHDSLRSRFSRRMDRRSFDWMAAKLRLGAVPHHDFHVFDVYTRAGLMNDPAAPVLLETMDACRVSWATVLAVEPEQLLVSRAPLVLAGGRLALGEPRPERVARQVDGHGFVDEACPGDHVSVHWSWACEVLRPGARARLRAVTARCLALANLTI